MDWRSVPSLPALRAFEAAARLGSLSAAAAELNVTHAAIAQHVRTVETFVGQPLLQREGRGMVMTDAGAQLQPALTSAFGQIIGAVSDLTRQTQDGPLRISTTPNFAEHWLMPRLVDFWSSHPDIAVSVTPSVALIDLRRDGFDLAIRYGRGDWPGHDITPLVSADYVVAAAPSVMGDKSVHSLADLSGQTWLLESEFRETRRWAESHGIRFDELKTRDLGTPALVLSAARAGAGLAVLSRTLIAHDLDAGNLVPVLEIPSQEQLGYYALNMPGAATAQLRTFLKWLVAAT